MLRLPPEAIAGGDADELLRGVVNELDDPAAFERRSKELWSNAAARVTDVLRFKDGRVYERFVAPHRIGGRVVGRVISLRDIGPAGGAGGGPETAPGLLGKGHGGGPHRRVGR